MEMLMEKLSLMETRKRMQSLFGKTLLVDVYDERLKTVEEYNGELIGVGDDSIVLSIKGSFKTIPYITLNRAIVDIKSNNAYGRPIYNGYKPYTNNQDHNHNIGNPFGVATVYFDIFGNEAAEAYLEKSYLACKKSLDECNLSKSTNEKREESLYTLTNKIKDSDFKNFIFVLCDVHALNMPYISYHSATDVEARGIRLSNGELIPFIDSKRYIWRILTSNEGAEPLYENKQFIGRIHKTDFSSDAYVYLGIIDKFGYDVALRLLQDDYAGYHKKFEEYTSGKQPIRNLVQNTTSA
jgi:hypothetical protein